MCFHFRNSTVAVAPRPVCAPSGKVPASILFECVVFSSHFAVLCDMQLRLCAGSPYRSGSCYETATTRRFYHGRTETMRPCTLEAQRWCQAMVEPAAKVRLYVTRTPSPTQRRGN